MDISPQTEGQVPGPSERETVHPAARRPRSSPMETLEGPRRPLRAPVPRAGQPVCGHGQRTSEVPQREGDVHGGAEDPRVRPAVSVPAGARGGADEDGALSARGVRHLPGCCGETEPGKPQSEYQIITLIDKHSVNKSFMKET